MIDRMFTVTEGNRLKLQMTSVQDILSNEMSHDPCQINFRDECTDELGDNRNYIFTRLKRTKTDERIHSGTNKHDINAD